MTVIVESFPARATKLQHQLQEKTRNKFCCSSAISAGEVGANDSQDQEVPSNCHKSAAMVRVSRKLLCGESPKPMKS